MAKLVAPGGHSVELNHAVNTVGTDASNSIPIAAGLGLEAFHFALTLSDSGTFIKPAPDGLTLVNGSPLGQERLLRTGDTIQAGSLAVTFDEDKAGQVATSAPGIEIPAASEIDSDELAPETEECPEVESPAESAETESTEGEHEEAASLASSLFTIGGGEGENAKAEPESIPSKNPGFASLLPKIGAGVSIAAMLAATGLLGWQNRDILASLGFGTRDNFHYVEKYAPANTTVAGSVKPVELYQSIVYHLSSVSDGMLPFEPESLNEMMKAQAGVNIYDFERVSFAGNPSGTLTVVVTFKGDMPEEVRNRIEMASEPRKAGPLKVYGSNMPDGRVAEITIPDSKTLVAVLGSSFTELAETAPSERALSLIGRVKPMDGTIVVAGNIASLINEIPNALKNSPAPIPMSQVNAGLAEAKALFKDVDSFLFSMTLGNDTNMIIADMFTKPGTSIDLGALTRMMGESREEFIEESGDVSEAIAAETKAILDSMKLTPRDGGMRFSMEVTNDQIGNLQEESQRARTAMMEAEMIRQRDIQEKLQQAALEGAFEAN